MNIPLIPVMDNPVVAEMNDTLTNIGWLTSDHYVLVLEKKYSSLTEFK